MENFDERPVSCLSAAGAACRNCQHWSEPPAEEVARHDAYVRGVTSRPVRRPLGSCDRVLLTRGRPAAFSATAAEFSCLNFQPSQGNDGGGSE